MKKIKRNRILAVLLFCILLFTGLFPGSYGKGATKKERQTAITICLDSYYKEEWKNGKTVPAWGEDAEYILYTMAKAGYKVRKNFYKDYLKGVNQGLKKADIKKIDTLSWAKLLLAITAMGYSPGDIKGVDVVKELCKKSNVKKSTMAMKYTMVLLAMREGKYSYPKGKGYYTKKELIEIIAKDCMKYSETTKFMDYPVMYAQALLPYQKTNKKAKEAVAHVLTIVHHNSDSANVWSKAQVLLFLAGVSGEEKNQKQMTEEILEEFDFSSRTTTIRFDLAQIARGLLAGKE